MSIYNVLTEPWIVVTDMNDQQHELGILETLNRAHELKAIVDPAPTIQFGIYRVLIVFVQHALRLKEFEDLEDVLLEKQFDPRVFESYVQEIGEHRFDLFDPNRPFLQSQPIPGDIEKPKSVVELFYQLPTGTNVLHFFYMEESDHAVCPAVATRALCSIAPFMTSGGAGYSPSINGTPPWYVLIRGNSLFETVLLNCGVMDTGGLDHETPPAWASDADMVPRAEKAANSLFEGWTWQSRQVRFLPSPGGTCTYSGVESSHLIREMAWGPGHKFGGHDRWIDPHVVYVDDAKRGRYPLRPREGRQLWRDYGPLFLLRNIGTRDTRYFRPAVVDQLEQLTRSFIVSEGTARQFEVYGMRADKAKVFEWNYEVFTVQAGILEKPHSGSEVYHALELAEKVATAIYSALKLLYPRGGGGNKAALNRLIQAAQMEFWSSLEVYFEGDYLAMLAALDADDEAGRIALLEDWKEQLRSIGRACLERALRAIESGAIAIRRQVMARNSFSLNLSNILGSKKTNSKGKEDVENGDDSAESDSQG